MGQYIDRPPRIQPELPEGKREIPQPPNLNISSYDVLIQSALPMVTIIGYVAVAAFGKGSGLLMMIPMSIAMVGASMLAVINFRNNRKKVRDQTEAYLLKLVEVRKEMLSYQEMQRMFYNYNYPEPEITLAIANDLTVTDKSQRLEDSRSGSRMWERRATDHDFGHIRLGRCTRPSSLTYTLTSSMTTDLDNVMIRDALRLKADSQYVSNVPITLPMRQFFNDRGEPDKNAPACHSIGICGNSKEAVYAYITSLLVDFAAFHSPTDALFHLVGSYESRLNWRWLYSLPHSKTDPQHINLFFEEEQKVTGENEIGNVKLFWKNLRNILDRRKQILEEEKKDSSTDPTLPFLLVIVDVLHDLPGWSNLRDLESESVISTLFAEGPRLGAAVIFLVPERSKVPGSCKALIEVQYDAQSKEKPVFRYTEVNVNSPRYVGAADLILNQDTARKFAHQLEPLSIRRSYGADLGTNITVTEMAKFTTMEELIEKSTESWTRSKEPKFADWLGVNVGLMPGNDVRRLVFSAKADGVHGLVAGSTGSGKSELLMTLILGMAIDYDPSIVNFVLVDYKGGSAFEPFRNLPHVVDIVTNLEAGGTARMFASVIAELNRRQRINTYTNSKDIVHYRRKGLHLKSGTPPYPHLFIIIDEFAEMIAGNAEFKAQLESITRLGRALGVSLILAAQRPVGVTDQMRANIKFRICLRVETPDDSRELLRRSDAAFLPPTIPGRGYLQIGNENIELVQVAHTGGDYLGTQAVVNPNVIWLDRQHKVEQGKQEAPKLFEVTVENLATLAKQISTPQWRPWPAFLPRNMSLRTPIDVAYLKEEDVTLIGAIDPKPIQVVEITPGDNTPGASAAAPRLALNNLVQKWLDSDYGWKGIDWTKTAMRPIVGIMDNPYDAIQLPLVINFTAGHMAIFGSSGWGKTTFLKTLVTALTVSHSPDELQIYILDFAGRNLSSLEGLPHVGAIITADEDERILRLFRYINSILEQRQVLLSQAGINDLYAYNEKNPDNIQPVILVLIDNFAELKENFENLLAPLTSLVREARAYGIHFAVTADAINALPSKMFSLFTEKYALKMSDTGAYSEIVGRVPDIASIAGRGYFRVGRTPLEFQAALPIGQDENAIQTVDENERLVSLAEKMTRVWDGKWKGKPPATIEILPVRVPLENILKDFTPPAKRLVSVLGINDQDLQPYVLDLQRQGPHMIAIGPPNSGKTTFLRAILLSMASLYSSKELKIVLGDFQRKLFDYGGKHSLGELPQVIQTITRPDQLTEFITKLKAEAKDLVDTPGRARILVIIDNYDSFSDDGNRATRGGFEELGVTCREYSTSGLSFIIAGSLAITNTQEDLRKQITSAGLSIALQNADAVNKLNGKISRSLAESELPIGRDFIIKSGRTTILQAATPYASDDNIEGSLDAWVEQILKKFPDGKAEWIFKPEPPAAAPADPTAPAAATPPSGAPAPSAAGSNAYSLQQIEELKKQLVEKGMQAGMLQYMQPEDIVKIAISYKIIPGEAPK